MAFNNQDYTEVVVVEEADTITVDSAVSMTSLNTQQLHNTYTAFPNHAAVQSTFKVRMPLSGDSANSNQAGVPFYIFSISDVIGANTAYAGGNYINAYFFYAAGPTLRLFIGEGSAGTETSDNTAGLGDIDVWLEYELTATTFTCKVYSDNTYAAPALLDTLIVTLTDPATQKALWNRVQVLHARDAGGAQPMSCTVGTLQFEDDGIEFVTTVGVTQAWNETTVSAGAEISSKGVFQSLDQRTVNDDFDSAVDTAIWSDKTAGSGRIDEDFALKRALMYSVAGGDVAMRVRKSSFDVATEWSIEAIRVSDPITANPDNLIFFNSIAEPGPMSAAAFGNDRVQTIHRNQALYINNVGGFVSWNGAAWVAGSAATVSYNISKVVFRNFDDSGTMKWQLLLYNIAGVLQETTTPVAWTATRAPSGGKALWVWFGTARNDAAIPATAAYGFQEWAEPNRINFLTSTQTCETDAFTFNVPFDSDEITIKLGRTPAGVTEVKVAVKENAGAFGASHNVDVTPIVGETGWFTIAAGTTYSSHNTVTLRPELNSPDSDTQLEILEIKIKGVTVAGAGGGSIFGEGMVT